MNILFRKKQIRPDVERTFIYWKSKDAAGKWEINERDWHGLQTRELKKLITLAAMPDGDRRRGKIRRTPWLKKSGVDSSDAGFEARIIDRIDWLKEREKAVPKHLRKLSPPKKRGPHLAHDPFLIALNSLVLLKQKFQKAILLTPLGECCQDRLKSIMDDTQWLAELRERTSRLLRK